MNKKKIIIKEKLIKNIFGLECINIKRSNVKIIINIHN